MRFLSALTTTVKSTTANGVFASWNTFVPRAGDLLLDVDVGALHERHDRHQRGDSHRQAKNGQDGPQLLRIHGLDGHTHVVPHSNHGCFHYSLKTIRGASSEPI